MPPGRSAAGSATTRGWIGDTLRFGVVGYTSQRLWGPLDKDGSGLLAPQQEGYSVIGEAFVSLKLWDQVLTGGRFLVNQPEINASDNRMTPITYSGGNLAGKVAGVDYYAGLPECDQAEDQRATSSTSSPPPASTARPASRCGWLAWRASRRRT